MKKTLMVGILLLLTAALVALIWWQARGVSHRDIYDAVQDNTKVVLDKVDDRADHLEVRLDKVEQKLESIESKLDRLIDMASHVLPDNLQEVH